MEGLGFRTLGLGADSEREKPSNSCRSSRNLLPQYASGYKVSGLRVRVSVDGFQFSGFGFWFVGFGLRVSGFEFRVGGGAHLERRVDEGVSGCGCCLRSG